MNDERLRTALIELGDVPPPPDLAGSALARARRDRRRRAGGVIVVLALLAAVAVTMPALVLGRRTAIPTAAFVPGRFMITGYTTVPGNDRPFYFPPGGTPAAYTRSRGGYAATPWRVAVPSPDGRLFAVSTAKESPSDAESIGRVGVVTADRLDDPDAVRWFPGDGTTGWIGWSPDSGRVFYQDPGILRAGGVERFLAVDVRSMTTRTVYADAGGGYLSVHGLPVVPPGGGGFALCFEVAGEPITTQVVRYFDQRGVRTRDVTVRGVQSFPYGVVQPFSPDGQLAAFNHGGPPDGSVDIVDLRSGRSVRPQVAGNFVGWYDQAHVVVASGRTVRVVELATGRVVAEKELASAGQPLVTVWLAPLTGAAPAGAVVL